MKQITVEDGSDDRFGSSALHNPALPQSPKFDDVY